MSTPGHRHVRRLAKTSASLAMALRRVSSAPKDMVPRSGNQTIGSLFVNIFQKKSLKIKNSVYISRVPAGCDLAVSDSQIDTVQH